MIKTGGYDIYPCLVPDYLPNIPLDPSTGSETGTSTYDSGYAFFQDSATKRITIAALSAELGESISITR